VPTVTLQSLDGHEIDRDGATFECRTNDHGADGTEFTRTVPLRVEFPRPDALRLVLRPNPEVTDPDESPLDLDYDEFAEPVEMETTVTEETVVLETAAVRFEISRDTAEIRVSRPDSAEILFETTELTTDARGEIETPSLGYTESQVDEWPMEVSGTHLGLRLPPGERLVGLGEQFGDLDLRGQRVRAAVRQPNGVPDSDTYAPVPFYLSDRSYGVLADTERDAVFDFGSDVPGVTQVTVEDSVLALTVFVGEKPTDVLSAYTDLTGRAPTLPPWTFGVWLSRNSYESAQQVRDIVGDLRERGFPFDVVHIDPEWMDIETVDLTWDRESFPDPEAFLDDLAAKNVHVSVWEYPYVKVGSELFAEAIAEDYVLSDESGRAYVFRRPSVADTRAAIVDFTDPDAVSWWQDRHRRLIEMGVDVFKTDFGEYSPRNTVTADGRTGRAAHNTYPVEYQSAVAGAFAATDGDEAESSGSPDKSGKSPVLWSRSGWVGAQQYPVHWGGDARSTWEGFATTVGAGLSQLSSGFQFWSCDIGGYKHEPSPELYVRWAQWGLLALSHPRFHGKTPREPTGFGAEAERIVTRFARLRSKLLPYYLAAGKRASETGIPVMRPMLLEYPDSPTATSQTQHMIGDSLLIAPVLDPGGTVGVDLPPGEWIDYFDGTRYEGPTRVERDPSLDEIPLFVRAGSAIPHQSEWTQTVPGSLPESLEIRVYGLDAAAEKKAAAGAAAETDATAEVYDPETDELVAVAVAVEAVPEAGDAAGGADSTGPTVRLSPERTLPSAPVVEFVGWTGPPPERVVFDGPGATPQSDSTASGDSEPDTGTKVHEYTGTLVREYTSTEVHEYTDSSDAEDADDTATDESVVATAERDGDRLRIDFGGDGSDRLSM
jgi:alpha-D-xyloside xylohydrolase